MNHGRTSLALLALMSVAAACATMRGPTARDSDRQIVHVLDRLAYGPRPGDVERVHAIGLRAWIERQLHPESIADEALEGRLAAYASIRLTADELFREYPRPDPTAVARRQEAILGGDAPSGAMAAEEPSRRIATELAAARMERAVWSERQLQEVLVDFWFNHFSVSAQKDAVRWMVSPFEREAIRPHVLGRFRDLVLATARHPAMLFYLDNWLSTREGLIVQNGPNRGRRLGLNENYARELLELHTLGVDGGYTQRDVVEVARAFTGWSMDYPRGDKRFVFRPRAHDDGEKHVLGHVIPAGGGEADGLTVIEIVTRHPSTARTIATKLVRRFVSDVPPPALVDRVARAYRDTDGDIRAMLRTIVDAPEFWSEAAHRAKVKKPIELVASAARALDARPVSERAGFALARAVGGLGERLFYAQAPTGYPDVAEGWVNSGALLARMKFALSLSGNRLDGVRVDLPQLLADVDRRRPEDVLDRLLAITLHGQASPETREILAARLRQSARTDGREPALVTLAALVLGSPEFQRR
jgi:uncharacterized protein (DUF1800 family)